MSPPGARPTPWTDVRERLAESDTYLVATVRPDARPHVVPVLAVWLDDALYFTAREATRKARNLDSNPRCAVAVGDDTFDLVIEGTAAVVEDDRTVHRVASAFTAKYPEWQPTARDGTFYPDGPDDPPSRIYEVTPVAGFGFGKEEGFSATRWRF